MIFLGTFVSLIDSKERVVVPKEFREILNTRFVAFRSHKFAAIDCFSMEKMEKLSAKIEEKFDEFSLDRDSLESSIFADAKVFRFDGSGRVILSAEFKQHASLEKEIMFVGLGATFQIWDPSAFKVHQAAARANLSKAS